MKILFYEDAVFDVKGFFSDKMSESEFFHFCQKNELLRLERDEKGTIILRPLLGFEYSRISALILGHLSLWNRQNETGICLDGSAGFTLPDNSVRSPNGSWIAKNKWKNISNKEKERFARICPNFLYEIKNFSDSAFYLKSKMLKWIENGCQLAWLIIPEKEEAYIYRADGSIEIVKGFHNKLSGENILPGFQLDLSILK